MSEKELENRLDQWRQDIDDPILIPQISELRKFKSACDQVRKFSKRPPDNDLLELYSLYKQATVGNVNIAKPSGLEDVKKWEAWNAKKGIAISTAKEQYIAKAKVLAGTYA